MVEVPTFVFKAADASGPRGKLDVEPSSMPTSENLYRFILEQEKNTYPRTIFLSEKRLL